MGIQQSLHFNTTITFASSTLFTKPTQSTKMAFFKTLLIASVAAVAFASPQGGSDGNTKVTGKTMASDAVCGNGQKLACCKTGDAKGNLINLELNCLSIPL